MPPTAWFAMKKSPSQPNDLELDNPELDNPELDNLEPDDLALDNPEPDAIAIPNLVKATPIIQMQKIMKTYGEGELAVNALESVNFRVERQDYCAIMGPSGSGKSTLMNMIGCLDRPTSGKYELDGLEVANLGADDLAEVRNRKIGFVFQQFHLLPHADAVENVMLPMIYAGVPQQERRDRAVAALTRVGLGERLNNKPNQLSGGQQQRVAIARAIVNNPVLLLADEPTGALDSQTTCEVLNLFSELHESGITVVLVTHEVDVAQQTERIVWMSDGQILHSHLTPEELGKTQGRMLAAPEKVTHHDPTHPNP